MIKFIETDKRKYTIFNDDKHIIDLNLVFSPVTNKFLRISEYIEDCSLKIGKDFDKWFIKYLTDYKKSNYNQEIIKKNIPKIKEMTDKYLEILKIDFEKYSNKKKIKKNSIFFVADEIKKIIKVSGHLKLYFIISQDTIMKLPDKFHKEIYTTLIADISNNEILFKLFQIITSKTYKYNFTDRYMWEYIKMIYCKTTDMHIVSIYNFILNNIVATCKVDSNPIPYITSVIDESVKWILKNVYKDIIVYSDAINTEDVYTSQGKDNLKTYAYNDTIGKILGVAVDCLDIVGIESLPKFKNSVSQKSLVAQYISFPILAKAFDIPYRHFITIPIEQAYLLNILTYVYLPKEFKEKYETICNLMLYYNDETPITKTTYKIKNISIYMNTIDTFLGFNYRIFPYDFYSTIVGKISRNLYINFINGKKINNFPLAKLEIDIIKFYNNFFSNKLNEICENICKEIDMQI